VVATDQIPIFVQLGSMTNFLIGVFWSVQCALLSLGLTKALIMGGFLLILFMYCLHTVTGNMTDVKNHDSRQCTRLIKLLFSPSCLKMPPPANFSVRIEPRIIRAI
jgi:hypothetical protein